MDLKLALCFLPGFVIGLTVHEAAHAITSKWLGDCLAEKQGRITLNPLKHLSPLGTLMLFFAGFGWGNPVPVNLYNFKNPKRDYLLCSLAGPASNILIGLLSLGLLYGLNWTVKAIGDPESWGVAAYYFGRLFLFSSLYINVILAAINLIPIPPLDGSKIWPCLIPGMRPTHSSKSMWLWVAVLIIMLKTGATGKTIRPALDRVTALMPPMVKVEQKRPKGFPEDLYAPPEAVKVEYKDMGEVENRQCYFMGFHWKEAHPAILLTDWLEQYTVEHHWQEVKGEEGLGEWGEKKDENGAWLFQRRYWEQLDGDILQTDLYRRIDPNSLELSKWAHGYFYYYPNEINKAEHD